MNAQSRPQLLIDFSALGGGQAASQLLNMLSLIVVARVLGAYDFGLIQLGVVVAAYAQMMGDAGLFMLGIREVSRMNDPGEVGGYVRTHLGLAITAAVSVIALGLVVLPLTPFYSRAPLVFVLYLMFAIPQTYMLDWVSTGLHRVRWTGLFWTLRSAVYAALVFGVLASADGKWGLSGRTWVPIFYLIAFGLADLALGVGVARLVGARSLIPRFGPRDEWRRRLALAIPIGMSLVVMRVVMTIDILILGLLKDPEVVGVYAAASRPIFVVVTAAVVAWRALMPRLSRFWSHDRPSFYLGFDRYCGIAFAGLVLASLGGFVLSDDILALLYGGRYETAGPVFRLLSIAYPLLALAVFTGYGLIASDRQRDYLRRVIVAVVIIIALLLVLIPRYGDLGAAWSMIAGSALLLVMNAFKMRDAIGGRFWRWVAMAIPMAALALLVLRATEGQPVLIRMALAALVYAAPLAVALRAQLSRPD